MLQDQDQDFKCQHQDQDQNRISVLRTRPQSWGLQDWCW